jgi:hypothetical protein
MSFARDSMLMRNEETFQNQDLSKFLQRNILLHAKMIKIPATIFMACFGRFGEDCSSSSKNSTIVEGLGPKLQTGEPIADCCFGLDQFLVNV